MPITYDDLSMPGISQKWILSNAHLYPFTNVFDLVLARSMFHVFSAPVRLVTVNDSGSHLRKNPASHVVCARCFDGRFMKCLDFPMGKSLFLVGGALGQTCVSHLKNQRIVFPCKNHYKSTSILRCDKGRKQTWTYC